MEKVTSHGFTLVELLMTIAIIGIIAGTVLASLNDARQEGIDAKIRGEMDALANRAAIEESQSFTYDIVCGSNGISTSTVISGIFDSINSFASSTPTCNSRTDAYAVSVPLGVAHWCVDSAGVQKSIPNPLATSPAEYQCP